MSGFFRIFTTRQVALACISFSIYTLLTTWQFGLLLVAILATHELGHLLAIQWFKLRPKGVFFIPFLGAITSREDPAATRAKEVIVIIAGPFAGAVFAAALAAMFWLTGTIVFAAAAGFAAMINLLNLFPIGFLDGGRILREVALSVIPRRQIPTLAFGIALAQGLTVWIGPEYWTSLTFLGLVWFFSMHGTVQRVQKFGRPGGNIYNQNDLVASQVAMSAKESFAAFTAHVGLALLLATLLLVMKHEPGASAAFHSLMTG